MKTISYKNKPTHLVLRVRDKTIAIKKEVLEENVATIRDAMIAVATILYMPILAVMFYVLFG